MKKEERIRIGNKIKELRNSKNMSQLQLAEETGLKQPSIARIEAGKFNTGLDYLQIIAEVFHCNIDFVKKQEIGDYGKN